MGWENFTDLIQSSPTKVETGQAGKKGMELDSRKWVDRIEWCAQITFETQEVGEIGWKEAGEWRGFPILWMGVIGKDFQLREKESKNQERLEI